MNSSLNPEAPEFVPHPTSSTEDGYTKVSKVIRSSHNWPSGASFDIFKTFTDFNIVSYNLSENVIEQTNQLLFTELLGSKLKRNDDEYNIEKIIDANDNMLDRVNINIDTIFSVNNPSQKFMQIARAPIISKIKVGSTTFIGAKNIPRPQLMFKDIIDNSENLWVPKISVKPNSIVPLALKLLVDVGGRVTGYEHPYLVELKLYKPSQEFLEPDPQPPLLPPPLEETKYTFVNTEAQLDELVQHLSSVNEVAIDLEHHSYRSYQGITCLLQISTNAGGDFIIDTLTIREHIYKLNVIFTDPTKLKVFHGAENDVLWLQRDFGVYIVGLFDTYQAARVLQLAGFSLKYLLMRYCKIDVDKTHQMADWRIRPLPEELIAYARTDTHYLLYVWRIMKSELLQIANEQTHKLLAVFEASRQVCELVYNKEVNHETSHIPLYMRSGKNFNYRQMTALKILYKWRDVNARTLDESDQYLMPNHMLLKISEILPREIQGILSCCDYVPPFVNKNLIDIHNTILKCLELPNQALPPVEPENERINQNVVFNAASFFHIIHDNAHQTNVSRNAYMPFNHNEHVYTFNKFYPDIHIFTTYTNMDTSHIVSNLNAEAALFISPYDRFRRYRYISRKEETKALKEREVKLISLAKNHEVFCQEFLAKLLQSHTEIDRDNEQIASTSNNNTTTVNHSVENENNDTEKKTAQRKRKFSTEKCEQEKIENYVIEKNTDGASKTQKMTSKK